jgi:hypothetical protein
MHARPEPVRRRILRRLAAPTAVAALACSAAASERLPTEWHVSTRGDDSWSGVFAEPTADGTDGPFRTLERARMALRRSSQEGVPTRPRQVIVHAGTYRLSNGLGLDGSVSGAPGAPTVIRSAGDGEVVLTSGSVLFARAFGKVTDPAILAGLSPEARNAVLELDGSALGFMAWPNRVTALPPGAELFIDGQRMQIARWPNSGWGQIDAFVDPGAEDTTAAQTGPGAIFKYAGDRPGAWDADAGVWLLGFWRWDWSAETVKVKSIDAERGTITLAAPTTYGVRRGNPSPRRFMALNVLRELDKPGEYWVDPASLRVVFWPTHPPADASIAVSSSASPVVTVESAHDVILSGLTIEATQSSCVVVRGGRQVAIVGCEVRNAREFGIRIEGGTGHAVRSCDVHSTGGGGIRVTGGDRKELLPCGHEITNCRIRRFSEIRVTLAHGLDAEGVGIRMANNLVEEAAHQAVYVQGNDNVFERNFVRNVCLETDDCGAYYSGRNPSCRGNLIRGNVFMDIGRIDRHGCASVYFDDGQGGDMLSDNVFVRGSRGAFGAIFVNGGREVQARSNVFIDCRIALGSAPWGEDRWTQAVYGQGDQAWLRWPDLITKEVDIRSPAYLRRYPNLSGYFRPQTALNHRNEARCNVLAGCEEPFTGDWQFPRKQNIVAAKVIDAFADLAAGNLSLRKGLPDPAPLTCYEPPSIAAAGLQVDSIRRSVDPADRPSLAPTPRTGTEQRSP